MSLSFLAFFFDLDLDALCRLFIGSRSLITSLASWADFRWAFNLVERCRLYAV